MLVVVAQKALARTGLNEVTFVPAAPQTRLCFAMAILTPTRTMPHPSAEVAVAEAAVRLIGAM
jgi:hypothetical protein